MKRILIQNGTIYDGLGGQPYQADLLVQDDRIAQIAPGITEPADQVIDATGKALLPGKTVYYTGHCTGDYAFHRLSGLLGGRLRPLHGGTEITVEGGNATP